LPPEIRNSIYRYALGGNRFSTQLRLVRDELRPILSSPEKNVLAILLVCRQTYAESALLPFQLSVFTFDCSLYFGIWCESLYPIQQDTVETVAFGLNFTVGCMSILNYFYRLKPFRELRNLPSLQEVAFYGRLHWDTIARDQLSNYIREAAQKKDLLVTFEED
jgi:hypothetical protein